MLQMDEELYLAAMMAYEDEIRHAVVAGKGWINEKVLSLDAGRTKLQWLHDANYIICGDPGEVSIEFDDLCMPHVYDADGWEWIICNYRDSADGQQLCLVRKDQMMSLEYYGGPEGLAEALKLAALDDLE